MAINEQAIFEEIQKIHKKQDLLASLLQARPQAERKDLLAALSLAQAEFRVARPHKENPYYKSRYETLADLVEASRAALCKNGLSVSFPMSPNVDDGEMITCLLSHSSGQELQSTVKLIQHRGDPRARASEVEYAKRMLYAGLIGVVADDDDDAERAMIKHRYSSGEDTEKKRLAPRSTVDDLTVISKDQHDVLVKDLRGIPEDTIKKLLDDLRINYLSEVKKDDYDWIRDTAKDIKAKMASAKGY